MIVLPLINALRSWRNRSRVSDMLYSMSDRQLADIGIDRSDIAAVANGSFERSSRVRSY
jgi:uncharacterized protein YjiS (DUF1127 family)